MRNRDSVEEFGRPRRLLQVLTVLVALTILAACAGTQQAQPPDLVSPPATAASTTSTTGPTTTTTTIPQTTATDEVPDVEVLLVMGDSIGLELYLAARQRTDVRGGPEVRYMAAHTPASCPDWPADFQQLIDDPATTAIILAAGFWLKIPSDDPSLDPADLIDELVDWLAPLAVDTYAFPTQLVTLESVDSSGVDERFQVAKSLLRAAADEVGIEVIDTYSGIAEDGERACLSVNGDEYPVRDMFDRVHHCPVAPLVMADAILDRLGVSARPVESADVAELESLVGPDGSPLFDRNGCEPLEAG